MSIGMLIVIFIIGALSWSFAEYGMHNWVGHLGNRRNEFSREHMKHHDDPNYHAPTWKKLLSSAAALVILTLLGWPLLGLLPASAFAAGFVAGYGGYEATHRWIHEVPPTGPLSRYLRRHHFHHHYADATSNHGVTSPLWDLILGTYQTPQQLRVPKGHEMAWMRDPDTGRVNAAVAADYVLA